MADKTKHSNDEIFDLLSAMAVDIEDLKNREDNDNPQSERLEKAFKSQVNMLLSLKKTIDSFPVSNQKFFEDWQKYQKEKDDIWREDMKDWVKQINENDAKHLHNNEIFKNAYLSLKEFLRPKEPTTNNLNENLIKRNFEPLIIPKSFKGWLKFLFYDCPKYSLSKPNRRKFLSDLGRTVKLLILVIVIGLLFLLSNDNHHLREKLIELQRIEQSINNV